MNKPAIFGALLLAAGAYVVTSCEGTDKSSTAGSGGSTGHASTGGATSVDSGQPNACGNGDAGPQYYEDGGYDGGLIQIGYTDPNMSVVLGDGGHYVMPNSKYKGYCFTYADAGGSSMFPPCGLPAIATDPLPPCFTKSTGLCMTGKFPIGSSVAWGGGFGCNLNQGTAAGALALNTDVIGMTSITIGVYGCAAPSTIQVQLNVSNPPVSEAGVAGDGFFCNRTTPLSAPDADGISTATIKLTDLTQDCWNTGGAVFDPATMLVKSLQGQINALDGKASFWDFCVSKLTIQ